MTLQVEVAQRINSSTALRVSLRFLMQGQQEASNLVRGSLLPKIDQGEA